MFGSESSANANKNSNFSQQSEDNHQSMRLARYRSAPSSFLEALSDNDAHSGDEAEALMFSSFFNGTAADHQMGAYEGAVNGGGGAVVGSYAPGMDGDAHLRMINSKNINSCNNLARQSSSPAGFLNGFSVVGDGGSYRVLQNPAETSSSANNRLMSNHCSSLFSSNSRAPYIMPMIPENGSERLSNGRDSWSGPSPFNGLKRSRGTSENPSGENGKRSSSTGLVHHLSLPKNVSEMAATAENFLHFRSDSIQIRAKRGCATHPRSIAERIRRTKISEKMKKLQDLFPNLDKQTNTADMLDMAVEYIKELQNQVQSLTESKDKCVCPKKP